MNTRIQRRHAVLPTTASASPVHRSVSLGGMDRNARGRRRHGIVNQNSLISTYCRPVAAIINSVNPRQFNHERMSSGQTGTRNVDSVADCPPPAAPVPYNAAMKPSMSAIAVEPPGVPSAVMRSGSCRASCASRRVSARLP